MAFSVQLYFDSASEQTLRSLWQSIGSSHLELGARPHISLAVFPETIATTQLLPAIEQFAKVSSQFSLAFASVGSFPTDEGVVFLAPVVTRELLSLHAAFHARLDQLHLASLDYYTVGRWVPHCTMAWQLTPDHLLKTLDICRQSPAWDTSLRTVTVTELALVESPPVYQHGCFALQAVES